MKMQYRLNNIIPLNKLNFFLNTISGNKIPAIPSIHKISIFIILASITSGEMMEVVPSTAPILNMLEPSKLPRAISVSFL